MSQTLVHAQKKAVELTINDLVWHSRVKSWPDSLTTRSVIGMPQGSLASSRRSERPCTTPNTTRVDRSGTTQEKPVKEAASMPANQIIHHFLARNEQLGVAGAHMLRLPGE